jgi:hypothetical protein
VVVVVPGDPTVVVGDGNASFTVVVGSPDVVPSAAPVVVAGVVGVVQAASNAIKKTAANSGRIEDLSLRSVQDGWAIGP